MSFPIKDFEHYLPLSIVSKGKDYWRDGRVGRLAQFRDEVVATVYGTEEYRVEIRLSGETVGDFLCDCPYDYGPVCKHIAAVLFELRKNQIEALPALESAEEADSVQQVIDRLSEDQMRGLLRFQADRDREFAAFLLSKFTGKT